MDREQPELIEREMEQTRESLTEKVSLLEQKVVGQIQSATDAVQDTVQCVRSAVQDTVQSVTGSVSQSVESLSEGVKDALDLPKQVRNNPWAMVGGATVAGFVTGLMVFRRPTSGASLPAYTPMPAAGYVPAASQRPGWLNDLFDLAGRELKKLAEQALAKTTSSLKQSVEEGIPKLIDSALPDVGSRRPGTHATDGVGTAVASGYYGPGTATQPDMSR